MRKDLHSSLTPHCDHSPQDANLKGKGRTPSNRSCRIQINRRVLSTVFVSPYATFGARRAVGTHYGPTRIHWAYTATRIRGPHYEQDDWPSYELHYGPRYRSSYAAMHAGPTTATAPPRPWTGRRTTLDTYIWRSRPRAPGAPEVMTPTCAAGDRTRSAEVCYTAGLNNAVCATRLRRLAKDERRGPDPSWCR